MSEEEEIHRGNQAQAIVNDPLFRDSMNAMKQEILNKWSATPARDVDGREWLWQFYQAALKFEESFQTFINTGKLAIEAKKTRSVSDRVRSIFG